MIDFDVVTGPNPSEKSEKAGSKGAKSSNAAQTKEEVGVPTDSPRPERAAKQRVEGPEA